MNRKEGRIRAPLSGKDTMIPFPQSVDPELQRRASEIAEKLPGFHLLPIVGKDHIWILVESTPIAAIKLTHEVNLEVWMNPVAQMDVSLELALAQQFDYSIHYVTSADDEAQIVMGPFIRLMAAAPASSPQPSFKRRPFTGRELILIGLLIGCNILWALQMWTYVSQLQRVQSYTMQLQQREACRHNDPIQREQFGDFKEAALYDCGDGTFLVEVWVPASPQYEFAFVKFMEPMTLLGEDVRVIDCSAGGQQYALGGCG